MSAQGLMMTVAWTELNAALVKDGVTLPGPPGKCGPAVRDWISQNVRDTLSLISRESLDAARWRALIGSGRIRVLGSAGLHSDTDPYGNPHDGYAHIGLELWTKHEAGSEPSAVEDLIKYVDIARGAAEPSARVERFETTDEAIANLIGVPAVGETWEHKNGRLYKVLFLTNTSNVRDDHPIDVVYKSVVGGAIWSRRLSTWAGSFKLRSEL